MKRLSHYHSRQNRDADSIILTFSPVQQMLIAMMEHNGVEALETFGGKQFFDHRPPYSIRMRQKNSYRLQPSNF